MDELSESEESQPELDPNLPITVLFPNSSKAIDTLKNKNSIRKDYKIQELLYNGKKFNLNSIAMMYEIQLSKYIVSSTYFKGRVTDPINRMVNLESSSNDSKIMGSKRHSFAIEDEMKFRMEQQGQFCLHVKIKIIPSTEDTISTVLLQNNFVLSVEMLSNPDNELERHYKVHNHNSDQNCGEECNLQTLTDFIEEGNFDMNKLKNESIPTFALMCAKKMEHFVTTIVRCPASELQSDDYFVQLFFNLGKG